MNQLFQGRQLNRSREILELFMAPRYTSTERDALKNPKEAMIIYNTTTDKINFYDGSTWRVVTST